MKTALLSLTLGVMAIAAGTARAAEGDGFEYHGYLRSGIGSSRGGTDQACFAAPGASAKFRLGNECDTYIEAAFTKINRIGADAKSPRFDTNFRLTAQSAAHRDWEPTDTEVKGKTKDDDGDTLPTLGQEFHMALREAYVQAQNVLGETKPWIGKRFYRRQDIHILDYYLIDNSGPGAGVEDIGVGVGKLHVAVVRNVPHGDGPVQTNSDLRLTDIGLGGAGKLEIMAIHGSAGDRGHESGLSAYEPMSGIQVGLIHSIDVFGGFNRVTVQYGTGLFGAEAGSRASALNAMGGWDSQTIAKAADATRDARQDSKSMRVAEELVTELGDTLSNSLVLVYQNADLGGAKDPLSGKELEAKSELMVGARPIFHFNDTAAIALEVGTTQVKKGIAVKDLTSGAIASYEDATLNKVTLAPQITAGKSFWARPTLRLFATYASWNDEAKAGMAPVYANSTNGFSTGAQVEAWW